MTMNATSHAEKGLAPPRDLSHHYSRVTKNRIESSMKGFYKYFLIPGIGNLAGGMPNSSYFPYDTLEASTALPNRFKPTPNDPVDPPSAALERLTVSENTSSTRVVVPHDSKERDTLRKIDLSTALQYGTAQGYPPLYTFLRQFTRETLYPNWVYQGGPEIILTCGSTDGFAKAVECLTNVWDEQRDWIREREGLICEEFAYTNAIQAVKPRGLNIVTTKIDDEGMVAKGKGGLEDVLENWDFNKGKRPHLIYTVTMGQNPTSGLLSLTRRKEIYAICEKYDVIIIEDDPYWYLQYPSANVLSAANRNGKKSQAEPGRNYNVSKKSTGFAFLDTLVPSYIAIDVSGRVIRLDTFSKTVAPGCRLGWITAQPALIERFQRIAETSTQQPSGFVQSMMAELIIGPHSPSDGGRGGSKDGSGWKVDGWVRWLEGLRGNYERRMQIMTSILDDGKYIVKQQRRQSIAQKPFETTDSDAEDEEDEDWHHVSKTKMYDFDYPMAGMFLWMHVNYDTHPLYGKIDSQKLSHALWVHMTTEPYLVLISPGEVFCPTPDIRREKGWEYFRVCFAAVNEEDLEHRTKAVVGAFHSFWKKKSVDDIDEELKMGMEVSQNWEMGWGVC